MHEQSMLAECLKPGCGFSSEATTPARARAYVSAHQHRSDHLAWLRRTDPEDRVWIHAA